MKHERDYVCTGPFYPVWFREDTARQQGKLNIFISLKNVAFLIAKSLLVLRDSDESKNLKEKSLGRGYFVHIAVKTKPGTASVTILL